MADDSRKVLIIFTDNEPLPKHRGSDGTEVQVIPRRKSDLDCENRRKLYNQGILLPEDSYSDLSIIRSRVSLDPSLQMWTDEAGYASRLNSRERILRQIEDVLSKSPGVSGVVLYYAGHATTSGDWCFQDGVITFEDIVTLYQSISVFRGRVLTVVCDCSHSGNWVKACCRYLDGMDVKACGHYGHRHGILLKVYASCRPGDVAGAPCFSVTGIRNDKNTGMMSFFMHKRLGEGQHTFGIDYTELVCKRKLDEPCALQRDFTWEKRLEAQRLLLVRGKDKGQSTWHYILLKDDEDIIKEFIEKTQGVQACSETINIADYGTILRSGLGENPPNDVQDDVKKLYQPGCD